MDTAQPLSKPRFNDPGFCPHCHVPMLVLKYETICYCRHVGYQCPFCKSVFKKDWWDKLHPWLPTRVNQGIKMTRVAPGGQAVEVRDLTLWECAKYWRIISFDV